MPIYSVQGPDGRIYDVEGPAGASEAAILNVVRRQIALETLRGGQSQEAAPESGFLPSLKSGASELKAGIAALAGRTGIMDQAAAEKYIKEQEEYQRKTFKPTETFGEAPITKTLELLGGSLPYVAAPVAAGAAAATLPLTGTAATVAGLGAAGLASATQFTGSNLRSQMGTGKTLGETDVQAAALASIPQAALDALSFKMIPGIRSVLTAAGKEVTPKAAKAIAEQSIREAVKDYAVSTGKAMGTEGLTEVGQQVLERMQAGLNITDEQARSEYYDSLIGGAVLGGVLSPAGRYMERRGEARKEEETALQKALADRAKEEKAKAEEKASPDYALRFVQDYDARLARFQELKKIEKPGSDATPDERVAFDEVKKERNALNKSLTQDSKEYREAKKAAEQLLEQQRREQMSPEAFMLEQMGIKETPVEEAAPPAMRTVVDEMGRITEVPVDQAEAPSAAEQYATQQIETARSAGLLTLPDLREYLMSDPALARQVVDERVALPGMTRKESNALLDSMNSEFRAQDKRAKELEKGAAKEAEARQENIRAAMAGQAPGAELMGAARKMPGVQAAAQERVVEEARQAKVRPEVEALQRIAERPVTGMDQFDLSGIAPPAAGEPAPAVRPTDTAADVRNQIEDLFKQVEKAQQEATTARAAGESAAATAAQARAEEALNSLNRIQGMSGESSAYATNMVQLRKAQEKGLFDLQESLDNIRRGAYLGGPASEEGTTTRALLQNKVDQQRADVINNVLKEAALHRRALGRPDLTTDETVAAADKLNTVLEEAITRMQSTPQKEEVVTVPAQMRGTQVVRGAETEMRDTRPLEERPLRAPVAAFKVFNEQVREIRDQLIGEAAPAVRQEPVLRQQFQTSEAQKVAEARGETATTLGGELRRRTEYVRDMMAKMQTMRPMARDVLNQAADVMDSGRATRELLDTVEPVVSAINTGKQITQTDLRAIKDSLAVISRAAQEGETVGKIEGQKDLFTDSTSRALQDRTLGVVRNTAQAFENAPVVKRARMAAEQAQQAAQRVAEQQAKQKVLDAEAQVKKAQDLARRISDTESSVEQQRQELQVELQRAMAEARPAITEHAQLTQDPAVAKAKAALEAAEKALAPLEEQLRPIMESDAPFGDKIKAAAPVYQQQKVVQQAREVFQKALSNSTERANGADVVAAAYRDALVQLEQKTLLKLQKKLDDLKAKASPPPQLTQAQQEIAMQRQRVAAAENAQREANLAADRAKREREQRLANMGGTRVVGGEATPILTPEERVKQAEKARADLTREMADTSIAGRGDIPQTARVTGPVTRSASSAPSAMRTGSAESKAGATSSPVAQGLSESRTPAKSTRPISSEEMQQANKEAAKISATKQPEDVAKAERESEQSAEDFAREEARAAQAEADRLRKKGKKGKKGGFEFSRGMPKNGGQTVEALEKALDKIVGDKGVAGKRIVLLKSVDAFFADNRFKYDYENANIPTDAKAFVNPKNGSVFMFADNIGKGEELGVLLHEVGVHLGFRNLFNAAQYGQLVSAVKKWAKLNDGSIESRIAKSAVARAEAAETTADQYDDELLAYAVEEAVKAGVSASAMKNGGPVRNWLRMVLDVLRKALAKYGINPDKLTSGDLVNMAYGAAQLELRGTWHGTDATFTAFDSKFSGAGEGSYEQRFEGSTNLGKGPYVTPDKKYAEYYQHAVPFGKAANASGYGSKTYQDYRSMDSKFLGTDKSELSLSEMQTLFESNLLTRYLQDVSAGGELDPAKNDAVKKYIPLLIERFSKNVENAEKTLDRKQRKGEDTASAQRELTTAKRQLRAAQALDADKIVGLKTRPSEGNLYRTLDAIPPSRVFGVNEMHTLGARPKLDALMRKYASQSTKDGVDKTNEWAGNSLFYTMRDKLGIDETVRLLKESGIEAIEQKNEGKYTERAYIDQVPEIIGVNLEPVGPATGKGREGSGRLLFSRGASSGSVDTSGALYRVRPKYKNNDMAGIGQDIRKVVAQQKSWADKIKANSSGLAFETALVDRFAGFERLKKYMEPLKGSQMMYYLRMYDQRMNFVSQSVGNGALERVAKKRADGQTEYVIESKEGANIANVVKILKGANKHVGNAEAVNQMFTTYLAALRAKRVGLSTLDFGGTVTQDMLNRVEAAVEGNADLKDIFNKARDEYNAYNRNLLKFVAESGALSKDLVNKLSRTNDYIPFYREQNGAAMLFIAGESPIRIGSIAEQPYLKELVGGDQPILDFMTSAVQNTNMLVDMALRNIATKNAVFELVDLNAAKLMKKAEGPDVVTFKIDGKDMHAVLDTESVSIGGRTFSTGVPADLLVKGMEGIPTQMPTLFRVMAMPAQLLRKAVTLSPMYMAKQLFRDSLAAPMIAGANFTPVLGALRQINGTAKKTLEQRGITGGQQFQGTTEDLSKILRDIADGKPGWMTALGKVEALGMEADALTRRAQYNSYIEQGMSEMEATLLSLESMNFNKRGASPSVHVANAMIPFFNAQIQGLNVMYKALTGQLPFNDKIKMRQKLLVRGGMMAVATLLYAALMEDDETYQNATPDQKYANWFVRVPGVEEAVRVPIPFEIGYVFKALPEALYNSMRGKEDSKDAAEAFRQILLQSVPGGSSYFIPQIAKPAIEAALGKSFYTGRDILSAREKELMPEEQFRANTSEVAKAVGRNLGISPVVMENLVRGYTGTMGLAFLHALGVGMPKTESPEAAVKRLSDMPIVGGSFQPNNAGNIVNNAYERFNEDISIRNSYKKMVSEGRTAEANSLLQRRSNEIMEAELGDIFKSNMNKLTQAERAIAASSATPQEKRQQLDEIRRLKTMIARSMRDAAEKTKPQ